MAVIRENVQSLAQTYLLGNYGNRDLMLVRGEGVFVWDADGRRYMDLLSGIGVCNVGHCHPRVVQAIQEQAQTLLHVSNLYLIEPQIELARLLVEHSPCDKAFFCNSGTEANEAAIKMARKYSYDKYGSGRHRIVTLEQSFHGRTMGSLTATGQAKYHKGFEPMLDGFQYVPINNIEAMREAVDDTVCAVILEPVQGEGGIRPCDTQYVRLVRELCNQKDVLLVFDEVQCGLGRSGHLFASEEFGVNPDMISLAKSLGGGVAIGALLAKDEPAKALVPGTHAATFGGNPLACAAAVATLKIILEENLAERAKTLGAMFHSRLEALAQKHSSIVEVRGKGLMIGVQMDAPAAGLLARLRERGYLAGPAGPDVLRFLPPLVIEEAQLLEVVNVLDELLTQQG